MNNENVNRINFFYKILLILLIVWFLKETFYKTPKCKSTFIVPQTERQLMKKNTIYIYTRNPFLDDTSKDLDIETLRDLDDLSDRSKFSELLVTYYNLQNQHFHVLNDIQIVLKQLRNLYNITDVDLHTSALNVVDFSDNIVYTKILNELSSTLTDNTKLTFETFTSTYDANIIANLTTTSSTLQTIMPKKKWYNKF